MSERTPRKAIYATESDMIEAIKKPLKISFIGSHGTGKTTLAYGVYKWLSRICKSDAELICESSDKCSTSIGLEKGEAEYEKKLVEYRKEQFDLHNSFISDRSLLDPVAYNMVKTRKFDEELFYYALENSKDQVLFYIPIAIPLVGEGHRPECLVYQKEVDKACQYMLKKISLNVYTISRVDMVERLSFVKHVIIKRLQFFGGHDELALP